MAEKRTIKTEKQLAKEKEEKLVKKDLRLKMLELLKESSMDERFTVALRDKQKKGVLLDYPERTICGCDGEVYNLLMNWAFKNKIPNHMAFDSFVEKFGTGLDKIKQRPKTADNAAMRYWKTKPKPRSKKATTAKGKNTQS